MLPSFLRARGIARSADPYSRYATAALHDALRDQPGDDEPLDSPHRRAQLAAVAEALAGDPDLQATFMMDDGSEAITPLGCTGRTGQWAAEALLLEAGAAPDGEQRLGLLADRLVFAHHARDRNGAMHALNVWLDLGVDVQGLVRGQTLLQPFVRHPNVPHWPVSLLQRLGVQARDPAGRTILHALWEQQPSLGWVPRLDATTFARMVRAGADPYAEDHEGVTALNLLARWAINGLVMPEWLTLLLQELPELDLFRGNRHGQSFGGALRCAVEEGRTFEQAQGIVLVLQAHERAMLDRIARSGATMTGARPPRERVRL